METSLTLYQVMAAVILASFLLLGLLGSVSGFFLVFWFRRVEDHIRRDHDRWDLQNPINGKVENIWQSLNTGHGRCCIHCNLED